MYTFTKAYKEMQEGLLQEASLHENIATDHKLGIAKKHEILTMWQLEAQLTKEGLLNEKLKLSFFCPVYFAGQKIVQALLKKKDEHDEMILFPLPTITEPSRIKVGLEQMERLGIPNPKSKLEMNKKDNKIGLPTYSMLPGIEGVGSERLYEFIAYEAVQLGCFSIVPKRWLNGGVPYNQSYKFPGEEGYSPFWRIPSFDEFKKMRPDLAKGWDNTSAGIIKTDFKGM